MKRVLSGIQPSGKLHIGNYFGMMQPMIRHMETTDLYVFIVDLHALTSVQDRDRLRQGTLEAAADFLALGLDPDRCTVWVQSDVPEVCELTWMLSVLTPMGLLERCHAFKDKVVYKPLSKATLGEVEAHLRLLATQILADRKRHQALKELRDLAVAAGARTQSVVMEVLGRLETPPFGGKKHSRPRGATLPQVPTRPFTPEVRS